MKILYIFTSPSPKDSSVQTKVKTQIQSLNQNGVVCEGAFIGTSDEKDIILNNKIKYYKIPKCNWKYFKQIGQQKYLNNAVFELIKNNYKDYDIFYIRYFGASKYFYKVSKYFGSKIVTEHQSIEIKEIISLKNQNPFSLNPSRFLSWIQYFLYPIFMEKFYGKLIAKNLLAAVCVTNEIAISKKKIGFKNTISLPNGIGVQQYKVRESPKFDSKLKLIFLKGTNSMAPWNGFERIVSSIDSYNKNNTSQFEIELIVCGHKFEGEIPNRDYVKHLGYLTKIELDNIMNEVHIGVSTMESYKEGIFEASRLKAREYVARGIPFIYANDDLDFTEDANWFALKLSNSSELIDFNKVLDFANKVLADEEHPHKMRKYAEEHLDYEVKMNKLYKELLKLNNA
jgi:hypothetical protein